MRFRWLVAVTALILSLPAAAQIANVNFAAGSPADADLQAIGKEPDAAKQKAMYTEFVTKYASDPLAVAYGNAQIGQLASAAGDCQQAMEYNDKALAAVPNYLDALVAQTQCAQTLKLADKIVEYASRGGKAIEGIGTEPKPASLTDEQWASDMEQQKKNAQPAFDFMHAAAFSAITIETDADKRWAETQQFDAGFPKSPFAGQVATLAMYALQQKGDYKQLAAFGEKLAADHPKDVEVLGLMAGMLAEDPKRSGDTAAVKYAKQAIEAGTPDDLKDPAKKLSLGLAHGAIGWVSMKQEKTQAAIGELKQAADLAEGNDAAYSTVMYRLGFAYAKLKQYGEAKAALNKCSGVEGPYKDEARKLLVKVNAAAPKK